MTKNEAKQLMGEGKKVTHPNLSSEWIKLTENGKITNQSGYIISPLVFWYNRCDVVFNNGWEEAKE